MKLSLNILLGVFLCLVLVGCSEDAPSTGAIKGTVVLTDSVDPGLIERYGLSYRHARLGSVDVELDADNSFELTDLPFGVYTIRVKTSRYEMADNSGVVVLSQEAHDQTVICKVIPKQETEE